MTPISIVDIARITEVSPSTVSRALQDHPRISAERRAEIQRLAETLGYRPNQIARGLVTGRSHMLGAVVTDVTDPFVAEVLTGAQAAAREAGAAFVNCIPVFLHGHAGTGKAGEQEDLQDQW